MKKYNSLQKTANKYIKKLNRAITFDSVVNYLQTRGYTVMYYSTPECSALLEEYGLINLSKSVNAITYSCDSVNLVFINDKIPLHDMICSILHETAHILLGHMSSNPFAVDNRQNEMEAEALAYTIMNYKKSRMPFFVVAIALIVLLGSAALYFCYPKSVETTAYIPQTVQTDNFTKQYDKEVKEKISETVLVTPYGTKYHRSDCRYVKNKNCTTLTRTEADKKYAPCSVCKP